MNIPFQCSGRHALNEKGGLIHLPFEERFANHGKRASVLVPLFMKGGRYHMLFEVRSGKVSHPGQIAFPGGHYDPGLDSSLEETAVRETCEEIGVTPESIRIEAPGGIGVNPWGTVVFSYIGFLQLDSIENLDLSGEVDHVFSIPLEKLMNGRFIPDHTWLTMSERRGGTGETRPGVTAGKIREGMFSGEYIPSEEGDIWGITGMLLKKALFIIKSSSPNLP